MGCAVAKPARPGTPRSRPDAARISRRSVSLGDKIVGAEVPGATIFSVSSRRPESTSTEAPGSRLRSGPCSRTGAAIRPSVPRRSRIPRHRPARTRVPPRDCRIQGCRSRSTGCSGTVPSDRVGRRRSAVPSARPLRLSRRSCSGLPARAIAGTGRQGDTVRRRIGLPRCHGAGDVFRLLHTILTVALACRGRLRSGRSGATRQPPPLRPLAHAAGYTVVTCETVGAGAANGRGGQRTGRAADEAGSRRGGQQAGQAADGRLLRIRLTMVRRMSRQMRCAAALRGRTRCRQN